MKAEQNFSHTAQVSVENTRPTTSGGDRELLVTVRDGLEILTFGGFCLFVFVFVCFLSSVL